MYPVDPFDDCDLELAAGAPGAVELDEFGFEGAFEGFGRGVDAPICQECRGGVSGGLGEGGPRPVVVDERVVDLACDKALQTADDVLLREALRAAAGDVIDGRLVPAHAHDHDPVERCVGLTVTATE